MQKVLVGREIAASPTVLMVAYPVRGLDINSSYTIFNLLNEQKERGAAVIFVGEDLDVLLELCDRILVICHGQISGIVDGKKATKEGIGMMMTSLPVKEEKEDEKMAIHITGANFDQEVLNSEIPVIVDFWAEWCGPCKMEMPDFNEAYSTYKDEIEFLMVNAFACCRSDRIGKIFRREGVQSQCRRGS